MRQEPQVRPLATATHLPSAGRAAVQVSSASIPALGAADAELAQGGHARHTRAQQLMLHFFAYHRMSQPIEMSDLDWCWKISGKIKTKEKRRRFPYGFGCFLEPVGHIQKCNAIQYMCVLYSLPLGFFQFRTLGGFFDAWHGKLRTPQFLPTSSNARTIRSMCYETLQ